MIPLFCFRIIMEILKTRPAGRPPEEKRSGVGQAGENKVYFKYSNMPILRNIRPLLSQEAQLAHDRCPVKNLGMSADQAIADTIYSNTAGLDFLKGGWKISYLTLVRACHRPGNGDQVAIGQGAENIKMHIGK